MHLGSDAIGTECAVVTWAVAAAGLGMAAYSAFRRPQPNSNRFIAAVLTAGVFAAQMFNVPILDFSSGHLVGGVLLAWVLGPALGACCMALVLIVQASLLGDGSIASLGANIINMSFIPALTVGFAKRMFLAESGNHSQLRWFESITAGGAALVAVLLAALSIPLEVALLHDVGGWPAWLDFTGRMAGIHLPIAVAEGLLTAGFVFALLPVAQSQRTSQSRPSMEWLRLGIAAAMVGLVLAIVPWSSPQPDGYEWSAEESGLQQLLGEAEAAEAAEPMFSEATMAVGSTLLVAMVVAGGTLLLPSKRLPIASRAF